MKKINFKNVAIMLGCIISVMFTSKSAFATPAKKGIDKEEALSILIQTYNSTNLNRGTYKNGKLVSGLNENNRPIKGKDIKVFFRISRTFDNKLFSANLHGLNVVEAKNLCYDVIIRKSILDIFEKVQLICGKGNNSYNHKSVLMERIPSFLFRIKNKHNLNISWYPTSDDGSIMVKKSENIPQALKDRAFDKEYPALS